MMLIAVIFTVGVILFFMLFFAGGSAYKVNKEMNQYNKIVDNKKRYD